MENAELIKALRCKECFDLCNVESCRYHITNTKSVAEWCENIDISPFTVYWWIREKGTAYAEERLSEIA